MSLSTRLVNMFLSNRELEIDHFRKNPLQTQQVQFSKLIEYGSNTIFGKGYDFASIKSIETFQKRVPIYDYDTIKEFINRSRAGEKNVLWPTDIHWYAKSSGTTSDQSKFIPVSDEGLSGCHLQGPRDVAAFISSLYPDSNVFDGKTLTLGGSHTLDSLGDAQCGDLSAILIENTPKWASWKRAPKTETALITDFEEKVYKICEETVGKRITAFAGVPSWNLVMINKILEYTGKQNLLDVWPDIELFVHGGMSFEPYRDQYKKLIPSPNMKYMETYNASEGFFAIQDDPNTNDMLLMLDYGVFFEFLPVSQLDDTSKAITLGDVKIGENYAVIITTINGLWRYIIGDTVEFTSAYPYKIRFTGRTKLFMNAFGEEIIIDNAEMAMREACRATSAQILDYSAAPIYMTGSEKGAHQWLVEFSKEPDSHVRFTEILDKTLQNINSDYAAKRNKDTTLHEPIVTQLRSGAFYEWMSERGRLGGQNKVPRLHNDRKYVDQLLKYKKV